MHPPPLAIFNNGIMSEAGFDWFCINLESALMKVMVEPNNKPYTQADVDKFIEYVVNGGKKRDILGDYKDFILSKANLN